MRLHNKENTMTGQKARKKIHVVGPLAGYEVYYPQEIWSQDRYVQIREYDKAHNPVWMTEEELAEITTVEHARRVFCN